MASSIVPEENVCSWKGSPSAVATRGRMEPAPAPYVSNRVMTGVVMSSPYEPSPEGGNAADLLHLARETPLRHLTDHVAESCLGQRIGELDRQRDRDHHRGHRAGGEPARGHRGVRVSGAVSHVAAEPDRGANGCAAGLLNQVGLF